MLKVPKYFKKIFLGVLILTILFITFLLVSRPPKMIEIVLGEEVVSLNPYTFVTSNNQLLRNIYDPLVNLDSNMNIKPALAVSYGRLDDFTWELRLTPNASFHDGSLFTSKNVEHSFEELRQISNSSSLTDSIEEIKIIGDYEIQIKTKYKDPILLNKLALIPMLPLNNLSDLLDHPLGTGQYIYDSNFENTYILKANPNYFASKAPYEEVRFTTISDRDFRIQYSNINSKVVMIEPFPLDLKLALNSNNFRFDTFPNLSVNFFLFNLERPVFQSLALRDILSKSIRDEDLMDFSGDSVKPTDQFISNGVFGSVANINIEEYETKPLELAVKNQGFFGTEIKVALPVGLNSFKEFLQTYWFNANLRPQIDLIPYQELADTSTRENYDLIFLGWRSDYGEAIQFFESFTLENAEFNLGMYQNEKLNKLLEQIRVEFDLQTRQELLAQAMDIIVFKDPLGIPLFETEVIHAISNAYDYTPRADGYIDLNNLDYKYSPKITYQQILKFLNTQI